MKYLDIIYEDNDIIVCYKKPGVSSQQERGSSVDMVSLLLNYFCKSGIKKPFAGVVHRLDKPVAGLIVFGKSQKATKLLSMEIAQRNVEKHYKAIVCGDIRNLKKTYLEDFLLRDSKTNTSFVVEKNDPAYSGNKEIKKACLEFKTEQVLTFDPSSPYFTDDSPFNNTVSLVDIRLLTGRHHQIRVQFSNSGYPLYGDMKYNPNSADLCQNEGIALCSCKLSFPHPITKKEMTFSVIPCNSIFNLFYPTYGLKR